MISQQFNRGGNISQQLNQVRFAEFAHQVLSDTSTAILNEQSGIAEVFLRRTGWLSEHLVSGIDKVNRTEDGANLVINYPLSIRFLDLRRSRLGKMKKIYHPIYNKVLYGRVYAYAFARLRLFSGLTADEFLEAMRTAYRFRMDSDIKSNIQDQFTPGTKGLLEVTI